MIFRSLLLLFVKYYFPFFVQRVFGSCTHVSCPLVVQSGQAESSILSPNPKMTVYK